MYTPDKSGNVKLRYFY